MRPEQFEELKNKINESVFGWLTTKEVLELTKVSTHSLSQYMKHYDFPQPNHYVGKRRVWIASEVASWMRVVESGQIRLPGGAPWWLRKEGG